MVNGCRSPIFGKEGRVHIESSVLETRNDVRRNEKAKRSNNTELILFGQDGFGWLPIPQCMLTRRK